MLQVDKEETSTAIVYQESLRIRTKDRVVNSILTAKQSWTWGADIQKLAKGELRRRSLRKRYTESNDLAYYIS